MKKRCRSFLLLLLLCGALCVGAQAAEHDMLKVGLKYGSTAMDEANLQNYSPFGGYALGYYDSSRSFVQLAALPASYEKITVTQDKTYHVQLSESFYDYASAEARAAQYGGFAAYDNGAFVARVGNYSDYGSAQSALYSLGAAGTVVGGSSTGVTVIVTGTSTILFEFDQSGLYSLGIRPIEAGQKTVTWFRGYRYYGGFEYQRVTGGAINVINVVPMDDYVKGVIPWEMSSDWPIEALKAQAVCARTYVASHMNGSPAYGFDVTGTTTSQVYYGTLDASANSDRAVDETAGKFVRYEGKLCETFYFAADGGATEDSENVWVTKVPYLRGVVDPYEKDIEFYCKSWSTTISRAAVGDVSITYTPIGNAMTVTVGGKTYSKDAVRTFLTSVCGLRYNSRHFTVEYDAASDTYSVVGGGYGHNCGMSQWGAKAMAQEHGKTYEEIISFYYTGAYVA